MNESNLNWDHANTKVDHAFRAGTPAALCGVLPPFETQTYGVFERCPYCCAIADRDARVSKPEWGPLDYAEALEAAADHIQRGWCQGLYGDGEGRVCLGGAVAVQCGRTVDRSYLEPHGWRIVDGVTVRTVANDRANKALGYLSMAQPERWNDEAGRTKDEVVRALRVAAAKARREDTGIDVEAIAAGDYPGAPDRADLDQWARDLDIQVEQTRPNQWFARLEHRSGFSGTREGALYLLHEVYTRTHGRAQEGHVLSPTSNHQEIP